MKIFNKGSIDSAMLNDLAYEIRIFEKADSFYLVHIECVIDFEDKIYVVMDYNENQNLLKAINDQANSSQPFEEDKIWECFIGICFALEELHSRGIIHNRDIEPGKIFVNGRRLKLGINCYQANFGKSEAYFSPEMCDGDLPSEESEIWALGCVLYYMCNFELPFGNDKQKIITSQHKPIRSQYSYELKFVVDWCLQKARGRRPTIESLFLEEFIIMKAKGLNMHIPYDSMMCGLFDDELFEFSIMNHQGKIENFRSNFEILSKEKWNENYDKIEKLHLELMERLVNERSEILEDRIFVKNDINSKNVNFTKRINKLIESIDNLCRDVEASEKNMMSQNQDVKDLSDADTRILVQYKEEYLVLDVNSKWKFNRLYIKIKQKCGFQINLPMATFSRVLRIEDDGDKTLYMLGITNNCKIQVIHHCKGC